MVNLPCAGFPFIFQLSNSVLCLSFFAGGGKLILGRPTNHIAPSLGPCNHKSLQDIQDVYQLITNVCNQKIKKIFAKANQIRIRIGRHTLTIRTNAMSTTNVGRGAVAQW